MSVLAWPHVANGAARADARFPILGFLRGAAMAGYDLKLRVRNSVGCLYPMSDGSLYPALKKLVAEGLATVRTQRQGRRTRKVYAITPAGRARFFAMLKEPSQPVFLHDEAFVKLAFAQYDPAAGLAQLEHLVRRESAWSALFDRIVRALEARGEDPFRLMIVRFGREMTSCRGEALARMRVRLLRELKSERAAPARRIGVR
ncbi:MAG: PadR family transcriptional regulator, partial [Candidatus Binataceae bacterium]